MQLLQCPGGESSGSQDQMRGSLSSSSTSVGAWPHLPCAHGSICRLTRPRCGAEGSRLSSYTQHLLQRAARTLRAIFIFKVLFGPELLSWNRWFMVMSSLVSSWLSGIRRLPREHWCCSSLTCRYRAQSTLSSEGRAQKPQGV